MSVKWTGEQQQVIDARNQDVLVSAAAGSGKTAVLVERILKMITDEERPVDIDRLLVVTFTNAAASEMRGRIRDALEERAAKDPDNVHLQKQLVLVHNAKITTIHSFCLHVLRNHFQTIGLDPSFRIADEGEVLLLEQDAVKEVVNEAYETLASDNASHAGESKKGAAFADDSRDETPEAKEGGAAFEDEKLTGEEFAEFLEQFVTGKDDSLIEDWILQLYHTALGQPFPEDWLRQCREAYADAAWPKAEMSGAARPKAEMSGAARPKTEMSGAARPKAEMSGAARPKAEMSGAARPKEEMSGAARPKEEMSGAARPKEEMSGAALSKMEISAHASGAAPSEMEISEAASASRKKDSECSSENTSESRPLWLNYIENDTALRLEDVHETLRSALRLARDPDGPYPYEKALLSDLALVEQLEKGKSYEGFLKAFSEMGSFETLGRKKDDHISEEKKQRVKSLRDECKDQINALRDQYYYDDLDVLREEYFRSGIVVRVLTRLTEAFMKRLSEKKAQKNILDFGDMEHLALNALVTREKQSSGSCSVSSEDGIPYGSGVVYPTAVAREYAETFEEVMIDEYQDSNLVQEMILTSVSGRGRGAHNRFMVGDVKQSIYRFRLARPELFMEKYHRYRVLSDADSQMADADGDADSQMADADGDADSQMADADGDADSQMTDADGDVDSRLMDGESAADSRTVGGCLSEKDGRGSADALGSHVNDAGSQSVPVTERRIDLHRNFRSRTQVLESVNFVFRQIMQESLGGVAYDSDAALYPGAAFAEPEEPYTSETANTEPAESHTLGAANAEPAGNPDSGDAFARSDTAHNWYTSELLLLDGADASTEKLREEEARMIGRRIQELVGTMPVLDKESGGFRPARYGDIVILLRTISGWGETFGEVLSAMGIPCFTGSQKGYFSAAEVRVILSYLKILDNPQQDIPLAAVLRSPIGRFSDEELSRIRLQGGGKATLSFYDCCLRLAGLSAVSEKEKQLQKKMEDFLSVYQSLREKCDHTPIHLLLWEILDATGYGEYAAALPAGRQRKANLDMLVEKAIAYEATSYHGLYHFVRYIENLQRYEVDYGEASLGAEAGDTVRIMSIHKSKGLEFPIVFVSGMGKQFNESDSRGKVVMHPEWGIACDCVWQQAAASSEKAIHQGEVPPRGNGIYQGEALHQENMTPLRNAMPHTADGASADVSSEISDEMPRVRRATLLKKSIQQRISSENLGEELRVLYVAMTRAKEKLILTGGVKDLEKKRAAWGNTPLSYSSLAGASNYLDWVAPALMRKLDENEAAHFVISVQTPQENVQKEAAAREEGWRTLQELLYAEAPKDVEEETRRYLGDVFSSSYPYAEESTISGKYSVSELKKMSQRTEESDARELYEEEPVVPLIPRFAQRSLPESDDADLRWTEEADDTETMGEKSAISGAARGTAFHTFMENLDFSKKEDLRFQLEELISCGKMSEEEAASVNLDEISVFLRSSVGRRMEHASAAGELFREQPFVLGVPAGEILKNGSSEIVLVQGIIDAWFLEDGQIVLVDYKSDRVSLKRTLIKRYRTQIDYYAKALERLTGKKVRDRVIYSFSLGEEIYLTAR